MGTARSLFFTIASICMIIAGAAGLVVLTLMLSDRIPMQTSVILLLICAGLILVYSILNLIAGINGVRSRNTRSNSAVVIRIPQAAVILCLVTVILSFINGVRAWHMASIILTGIVIPAIFMYAAVKKSYV